ncbi:alpha/beta fold hydrolase [Pseudomonas japonica]|uniref:alpha/beta fold hydrolase n=1 Tax=Pseudomonas japonica TaxID=256466 RepID=UPI003806B3C7
MALHRAIDDCDLGAAQRRVPSRVASVRRLALVLLIMTARTALPGTPTPMHCWTGDHGNRLYGDSWGDPSAPPVVLLHGGGQTRHSWRHTARNLARAGFHALAYDARGHGDSQWVEDGDYSEAALARDLACVVRTLAAPPVLIGASMGGLTSLQAVADGVVEAAALILADVAHRSLGEGVDRVRDFMSRHARGFVSLEEAAEAIAGYRGGPRSAKGASGVGKNLRRAADGRLYWHWDPRFLDGRDDLHARTVRLGQCARRIAVPTLVVRGEHSDVLSREAVEEFLVLCPVATQVEVAGAGHMLTGDDNDAFGRMAIEFIRRVGG